MSEGASLAVSIRLDRESQRHLRYLEDSGLSRSEAIREALRIAADRMKRRELIHREAELVAADQDDRREMQEIAALMERLQAEG